MQSSRVGACEVPRRTSTWGGLSPGPCGSNTPSLCLSVAICCSFRARWSEAVIGGRSLSKDSPLDLSFVSHRVSFTKYTGTETAGLLLGKREGTGLPARHSLLAPPRPSFTSGPAYLPLAPPFGPFPSSGGAESLTPAEEHEGSPRCSLSAVLRTILSPYYRGVLFCVSPEPGFHFRHQREGQSRPRQATPRPRQTTPGPRPGLRPQGHPADISPGPCADLEPLTAMAPSEGQAVPPSRGPRAALNTRPVPLTCIQTRIA